MAVEGSPAVARHRLRLALRKAREAKDLTQGEVAASLDWSLSKLQRIEGGENSISPTDTRALLQVLGVTAADAVDQLVNEARLARRRGTWDDPRYRDFLTGPMKLLFQFEAEARRVRVFQTLLFPGPLQTRAVAEHILGYWRSELRQNELDVRLEARLGRRRQLFDKPNPADYRLILDESVMYRRLGGSKVYADQLETLLADTRDGRVQLRIAPFELPPEHAVALPFTVLSLDDEDNDAVLYREHISTDELVYDAEKVGRHITIFDQLWTQSYGRLESERRIGEQIKRLRAEQGRADRADRTGSHQ
jgi:transcriptional regulator with XRE-family HTH domain